MGTRSSIMVGFTSIKMDWIIHILLFPVLIGGGYFYRRMAWRKKIIDIPNQRSSHQIPVVRGGGILFFVPFLAWISYLTYQNLSLSGLWLGFVILSILGFTDDRKNLSPKLRFPVQWIAVALILHSAGLWTNDWHWTIKILVFIISIGFINAYNFMDGINGITGFYTLVLGFSLWYLNQKTQIFDNEWFILLTVTILAFGYFNFRKHALMFFGDIGTMSLSSVLLFLLIRFAVVLNSPAVLILVTVYGVDSAMTIIRRILKKENISQAHREHIYQKTVDFLKCSHLQVAFCYAFIQSVLNIWFFRNEFWQKSAENQMIAVILILLTFVMIYWITQKFFDRWTRLQKD